MQLRISSRQSDLARIQAYLVGDALRRKNSALEIEYRFRESLGDTNQADPLWKMPERGVFTEDFFSELVNGETDLVVHSWKDLPILDRAETEVVATLPRADSRDVLLMKKASFTCIEREKKLRVYSSSPRRARNLDQFLREHLPLPIESVEFVSVRGNVPTRIRKLMEDPAIDALIVAKAALDRLLSVGEALPGEIPEIPADERTKFAATAAELRRHLAEICWMVLPLSENPGAAAQGALAIEIRRDRSDLRQILTGIHDEATASAVRKEREILRSYGGGCHLKIGVSVLPRDFGEVTFLRGETESGDVLDKSTLSTSNPAPIDPLHAWPIHRANSEVFFTRRPVEISTTKFCAEAGHAALWISRENALPANIRIEPEKVIWCAGIMTWKKLAARGIWVNGSADSLGESELPQADVLAGLPLHWLKLSHSTLPGVQEPASPMSVFATYDLALKLSPPALGQYRNFYWMSGTSFLTALACNPEIRDAEHSCGPGRTYRILRQVLGPDARIGIELSYANWLKRIKDLE